MRLYGFNALPVIAMVGLIFISCSKPEHEAGRSAGPDQILEGFEVNHTINGVLVWSLYSEHTNVFEEKKLAYADNPVIKFYEEGNLSSTMKSDKGVLHIDSSDIEAWDNVVIVSQKEASRLETERAYYKAEVDKIFSDEKVVFYREDSITTGTGMESNADLSSMIIKNQKVEILK